MIQDLRGHFVVPDDFRRSKALAGDLAQMYAVLVVCHHVSPARPTGSSCGVFLRRQGIGLVLLLFRFYPDLG